MRFRFVLVALALSVLSAFGAADVLFELDKFHTTAVTNRNVLITPKRITSDLGTIIVGDKVLKTSDAAGQFWISNMYAGTYIVEIQAPPSTSTHTIWITNSSTFLRAAECEVANSTSTYPEGNVAWAAITSDRRFLFRSLPSAVGQVPVATDTLGNYAWGAAGSAATNVVWPAAGTNTTARTNGLVVSIDADVSRADVTNAQVNAQIAATNYANSLTNAGYVNMSNHVNTVSNILWTVTKNATNDLNSALATYVNTGTNNVWTNITALISSTDLATRLTLSNHVLTVSNVLHVAGRNGTNDLLTLFTARLSAGTNDVWTNLTAAISAASGAAGMSNHVNTVSNVLWLSARNGTNDLLALLTVRQAAATNDVWTNLTATIGTTDTATRVNLSNHVNTVSNVVWLAGRNGTNDLLTLLTARQAAATNDVWTNLTAYVGARDIVTSNGLYALISLGGASEGYVNNATNNAWTNILAAVNTISNVLAAYSRNGTNDLLTLTTTRLSNATNDVWTNLTTYVNSRGTVISNALQVQIDLKQAALGYAPATNSLAGILWILGYTPQPASTSLSNLSGLSGTNLLTHTNRGVIHSARLFGATNEHRAWYGSLSYIDTDGGFSFGGGTAFTDPLTYAADTGLLTAEQFRGNGSNITDLNVSSATWGTLPIGRLPFHPQLGDPDLTNFATLATNTFPNVGQLHSASNAILSKLTNDLVTTSNAFIAFDLALSNSVLSQAANLVTGYSNAVRATFVTTNLRIADHLTFTSTTNRLGVVGAGDPAANGTYRFSVALQHYTNHAGYRYIKTGGQWMFQPSGTSSNWYSSSTLTTNGPADVINGAASGPAVYLGVDVQAAGLEMIGIAGNTNEEARISGRVGTNENRVVVLTNVDNQISGTISGTFNGTINSRYATNSGYVFNAGDFPNTIAFIETNLWGTGTEEPLVIGNVLDSQADNELVLGDHHHVLSQTFSGVGRGFAGQINWGTNGVAYITNGDYATILNGTYVVLPNGGSVTYDADGSSGIMANRMALFWKTNALGGLCHISNQVDGGTWTYYGSFNTTTNTSGEFGHTNFALPSHQLFSHVRTKVQCGSGTNFILGEIFNRNSGNDVVLLGLVKQGIGWDQATNCSVSTLSNLTATLSAAGYRPRLWRGRDVSSAAQWSNAPAVFNGLLAGSLTNADVLLFTAPPQSPATDAANQAQNTVIRTYADSTTIGGRKVVVFDDYRWNGSYTDMTNSGYLSPADPVHPLKAGRRASLEASYDLTGLTDIFRQINRPIIGANQYGQVSIYGRSTTQPGRLSIWTPPGTEGFVWFQGPDWANSHGGSIGSSDASLIIRREGGTAAVTIDHATGATTIGGSTTVSGALTVSGSGLRVNALANATSTVLLGAGVNEFGGHLITSNSISPEFGIVSGQFRPLGLTTNVDVVVPGSITNRMQFSRGILTNIVQVP